MSIIGKIMGAIFGSGAQAAPAGSTSPAPAGSPEPGTPGTGAPAGTIGSAASANTGSTPAGASAGSAAGGAPEAATGGGEKVDVSQVLDDAVKTKGQHLEWRTSIVDLMKALDIDSSLSARKELAQELHYTGDMNDSAEMNMWLHKQVIKRLEENGGKVPADLKD